jgi:Peptidase family M23
MAKYSKPFEGDYELTSPFGPRDLDGDGRNDGQFEFHDGVDFACPANTQLYAFESGEVITAGVVDYANPDSPNLGVLIRTDDGNYWTYFHMNEVAVKIGQEIATGQYVGKSGMTGFCYGPHLHFGIYLRQPWRNPTDPAECFGDWDNPSTFIPNYETQTPNETNTNMPTKLTQSDLDFLRSQGWNENADTLEYNGIRNFDYIDRVKELIIERKQKKGIQDELLKAQSKISNFQSIPHFTQDDVEKIKIETINQYKIQNKPDSSLPVSSAEKPQPKIVPQDIVKQPNLSVVNDLQILAQKNIENLSGVKFDPSQVSMTKAFIFDRLSSLTSTRFFGSIGGTWLITTFGPDQTRNITAVFAIVILYLVSETIVRVQKNRK